MNKIDLIKNMSEINPSNPEIWYLLGLEYAAANQIPSALVAYSEALKYADDSLKNNIMSAIGQLNQPNHTDCDSDDPIDYAPFQLLKGNAPHIKDNLIHIPPDSLVNFSSVGGLEPLKDVIRMKIIKPFTHPGLFNKFRKKIGGGILLYGPPGCGKTFMAKATAGECNAKFIPVHITDILSKYIGESEQNIADIFSNARQNKPCILFFDELDTIGYNRSRLSSEHLRPTIDQLLTEIEGVDTNTDQLLIIGATNMPWDVDTAFKRPGRFDKTIFIPPPDQMAREAIFGIKLSDKPVGNLDLKLLASKTELYSGADIENVVEVAIERVISDIMTTGEERTIEMTDLMYAIEHTKASTIEWLRTIRNYVTYSNQSGIYDDVNDYLNKVKKHLG